MNCTMCGEMLFSALERTRGICATCFLSYRPERKAEATRRSPDSPPQESQPDDRDREYSPRGMGRDNPARKRRDRGSEPSLKEHTSPGWLDTGKERSDDPQRQ